MNRDIRQADRGGGGTYVVKCCGDVGGDGDEERIRKRKLFGN